MLWSALGRRASLTLPFHGGWGRSSVVDGRERPDGDFGWAASERERDSVRPCAIRDCVPVFLLNDRIGLEVVGRDEEVSRGHGVAATSDYRSPMSPT